MTDFNLIKLDGKPIEKLLDVVSNAIGTVYKPTAIRREADAKAYELKVISRAKAEALIESKEIDAEYYKRIEKRNIHQQLSKQQNIDNLVGIAIEQLSYEETVSDKKVNKDWTKRFFNIAEDISDEEMQLLWGKILAGEVKQPSSYSLRTLDILRNLTLDEAKMFTKLASLALYTPSQELHFIYRDLPGSDHYIDPMSFLKLSEAGLVYAEHTASLGPSSTETSATVIVYGKKAFLIKREKGAPSYSMGMHILTKSGTELSKLIETVYDESYIEKIADSCRGAKTAITFGDIEMFDGENIKLTNERKL